MAIEYEGETYTPKSGLDNALDILNNINTLLVTNNIKDSDGNQAVLYVNAADILWLFILAVGQALTVYQWLVQKAGDALSIAACSDQQVLNLAQIAGTEREEGSKTILFVNITAAAGADCTVAPENLIEYTEEVDFVPVATTIVPAGTTVEIEARSSINGAFIIAAGEITAFINAPANLDTIDNTKTSIPGLDIETFIELRNRLQNGTTLKSNLDEAILALRNLSGIQTANIFFNPSSSTNLVLSGGIVIPPRHCYIVLYGTSELIAETYFNHLTAETEGSESQDYISLSDQVIPVNYNLAILTNFFVKVTVEADSGQENYASFLKNAVVLASGSKSIGSNYSQQYLINYLDDFAYATVLGLYVSMDGMVWTDITDLDANAIGIIDLADITIEEK